MSMSLICNQYTNTFSLFLSKFHFHIRKNVFHQTHHSPKFTIHQNPFDFWAESAPQEWQHLFKNQACFCQQWPLHAPQFVWHTEGLTTQLSSSSKFDFQVEIFWPSKSGILRSGSENFRVAKASLLLDSSLHTFHTVKKHISNKLCTVPLVQI